MVQRQAAMLSFLDVLRMLALIFLQTKPLALSALVFTDAAACNGQRAMRTSARKPLTVRRGPGV
jgi:hypothetical protein